ncbi:MAG: LysR family transcriptional regulator [Myxococcota bacterium]
MDEFATIVEQGSISAAAREIGVPRATLSRRLAGLEDELGIRLVHRRTRSLILTDAGAELFRRARSIAAQASEAWEAMRRLDETPRGRLRVSVSEGIDPGLFLDFVEDYPEVSVVVRTTARYVDLIGEGIEVAIRYGEVTEPDLYVRRVATIRSLVVGSPEYLRRCGTPKRARQLSGHRCIRRALGDGRPLSAWPLRRGGDVHVSGRVVSDDLSLLRAAALRGEGLAHLPRPAVGADLRKGTLVPVLERSVGEDFPVCLVYADREFIEPKVRAFVDHAARVLPRWFAGLDHL